MYLIRLSHKNGKLKELILNAGHNVTVILNSMHRNNPHAYKRIVNYKQCRYDSKAVAGLKIYCFTLESLDWDTIQILVSKELEAHVPKS